MLCFKAWDVAEEDWEGLETHTVYVEVTDDANCWEHSGEGDRIGYATLEVTVSEDNQEPTVDLSGTGTDSESETTGGETVSSTGSETGGTETTPDEPASTGFDFGSIFESFLAWLRSLFG